MVRSTLMPSSATMRLVLLPGALRTARSRCAADHQREARHQDRGRGDDGDLHAAHMHGEAGALQQR